VGTPQRLPNNGRHSLGIATPPSTGSRRNIYSDRFIPSRTATNLEEAFDVLGNRLNTKEIMNNANNSTNNSDRSDHPPESQLLMNNLLRSELLGQPLMDMNLEMRLSGAAGNPSDPNSMKSPPRKEVSTPGGGLASNLFKYRLSSQGAAATATDPFGSPRSSLNNDFDDMDDGVRTPGGGSTPGGSLLGSPSASHRKSSLMNSPSKKPTRKIPKHPFKVLDAPSLQDDYYLNLVDWSHSNSLAVALCSSVYLWSACTSKVTKLCDFGSTDMVTSISWALTGNFNVL
jgi:cell division cycle 20-like protein 1 (cofactor of APC complex)